MAAAIAAPTGGLAAAAPIEKRSTTERIYRDYAADGKLEHRYTVKQLKRALRAVKPDVRQYSPQLVKAIKRELRRQRKIERST